MYQQKLNSLTENVENLNISDFLILNYSAKYFIIRLFGRIPNINRIFVASLLCSCFTSNITKINEKQLNDEVESKDDSLLNDIDKEQENILLAGEHEAIVKKQQQMLLADERGKQALSAEIAAIKQKQAKRAETLKNRRQALDIEKERSKWIASLPPPLPKSVKSLLRKNDDEPKTSSKADVKMPDELTAVTIAGALKISEDKENILDPEEMEAQRRLQEVRDSKAQKRFNEALKKDRHEEEYAKIMKQLQNAELLKRREKAKSISSEKAKTVPCPLSDKFQASKNQADMEDVAERIILKTKNSEHAIEDIEGYQDYYEGKYKNIDSKFEEKMIDCVPEFVKENYEYLLEDDSEFKGGKSFCGLNESGNDVLNEAYIATPPYDEGEQIDLVIDKLDQIRSDLQTEYDQTVKPLLVAAMELPVKQSADKAVETELAQPHEEEKSVKTEWPDSISNYGSLKMRRAFKRRPFPLGPFLPSYEATNVPDMHHKQVYYNLPAPSNMNESSTPSWSSSSYCSLPSKHGFPNVPGSAESVKCDICAAERNINRHMNSLSDRHPISPSSEYSSKKPDMPDFESDSASEKPSLCKKTYLSKYVKQLAKKYLEENATHDSLKDSLKRNFDESPSSVPSENRKIDSDEIEEYRSSKSVSNSEKSSYIPDALYTDSNDVFYAEHSFKKSTATSTCDSPALESHQLADLHNQTDRSTPILPTTNHSLNVMSESSNQNKLNTKEVDEFQLENHNESIYKSVDESEHSEYELEVQRLQLIKQILARRIPGFDININPRVDNAGNTGSLDLFEKQSGLNEKLHVYHELSTIHEVDSALTADSLQLSLSLEQSHDKSAQDKAVNEKLDKSLEKSFDKLKSISLLDPPSPEISELAKAIHFVPKESFPTYHKSQNSFTPSPMSSSDSSLSSIGKHGNHPFLQGTRALPKYVSDIRYDKPKNFSSPNSSESLASSKVDVTPHGTNDKLSIVSMIDSKRKQMGSSEKEASSSQTLMSGFISDAGSSLNEVNEDSDLTVNERLLSGLNKNGSVQYQYTDLNHGSTSRNGLFSNFDSQGHSASLTTSGSFHPMSPQYVSTPDTSRCSNKDEEGEKIPVATSLKSANNQDGECKKRNIHDDTSNCPLVSGLISNLSQVSASSESFYPLTPQFNVSTPTVSGISINPPSNSDRKYDPKSLTSEHNGDFKPMTPHSNVSTPSNQFSLDYKNNYDSKESFKPMTPHSDVSTPCVTPSSAFKCINYADSSAESFKTMTPKSIVSSPHSSDDAALDVTTSVENSQCKAFISRFDADQDRNFKQKSNTLIPQLTGNEKHIVPEFKKPTEIFKSIFRHHIISDKGLPIKHCQDSAHILVHKNFADINKGHSKKETFAKLRNEKQLESDARQNRHLLNSSSVTSSQSDSASDKESSSQNSREILHKLKVKCQDLDILLRKDAESKEIHDSQRQLQMSLQKKQTSSSTSSSSENLSDMFSGSKINYQSTPIKSLEEEMQDEKLISDENLTLVSITHLPSTTDSPEQLLSSPNSGSSSLATNFLVGVKDELHQLSESSCKTPTNENPQLEGPANTPSLLSFLYHENECTEDTSDAESPMPALIQNSTVSKSEDATPKYNEKPRSTKFSRYEFKQRTERLWNNLEEVKKQKLANERQKIMTMNRNKAKEYANKLAQKRKILSVQKL